MVEQSLRKGWVGGSNPPVGSVKMPKYSRRAKTEEKKNIRKAVFYGILTIAAFLALVFFGIPAIARFAAFLYDLSSSNQPVDINDTTPPAPPDINEPPEVISKTSVEITGNTEPGATVILFVNGNEEELLANRDGEFRYQWGLLDGENKISAKVKDTAGNESQETQTHTITYDDEPPELTIDSPEDGKEFYGSRERQITIEGATEEGASITINGRVVVVDSDGKFTFLTTLSDGENKFTIKATDKAGNETEKTLTLHFTS